MIKQLVIEIKDEKEGEDIFFDRVLFAEVWNPAIDIYETDEAIILLIELPGVKPADMNLSLNKQQNVLHIWGKRKSPLKTEGKNCHTMELHFGTFSRYVKLLAKVKVDKAELENMNGIFKITFKKKK